MNGALGSWLGQALVAYLVISPLLFLWAAMRDAGRESAGEKVDRSLAAFAPRFTRRG
jgi:hypothetical protein